MADTGIKDIDKAFKELANAAKPKVLKQALNASLNPVVKSVKANAPVGSKEHKTYKGRTVPPGYLKRRGIIKSTRISRDKKLVTGNVRLKGEAWYGSLIEHGFKAGKRPKAVKKASASGSLSDQQLSKLGDNRKKIPPKPWFKPAVERASDDVEKAYFSKMEQAILRAWRK